MKTLFRSLLEVMKDTTKDSMSKTERMSAFTPAMIFLMTVGPCSVP